MSKDDAGFWIDGSWIDIDKYEALEADNARLREALELISKDTIFTAVQTSLPTKSAQIARAALAETGGHQ